MLQKLNETKAAIEKDLTARSPLEQYPDVEKEVRERWEEELEAAIEAEYRRQRADLLLLVQRWLRDIWLQAAIANRELLNFPDLKSGDRLAQRVGSAGALENLQIIEETQRLLHTNVQEALALEVGLLKLNL